MSALTRLYRQSRAVRIVGGIALVPVYVMLVFVSINSFGRYSQVGDDLGVAAIVVFAGWAWWWSERRDARGAAADGESGHDG